MRDYLKELDIEFKKIDKETEKRLAECERKKYQGREKKRRTKEKTFIQNPCVYCEPLPLKITL